MKSTRKKTIQNVYSSALLLMLSCAVANAQNKDNVEVREKHIVADHVFLPSFYMPHTFADSHATLALGFGVGTFTDERAVGGRDLEIGSFSPILNAQINFWERLAVSVGANGNVFFGLNTSAIANFGASVRYSVHYGLIYEIIRNKRDVLSLAFDVSHPNTLGVSPIEAAREGISSLIGNTNPDYISDRVSTQWRPTIRFAHSFNRPIGVQLYAGPKFNTTKDNDDPAQTRTTLNFALKFDFDLKPAIGVPVGFATTFARRQRLYGNTVSSSITALGIYETVKDEFNIGIEIGRVSSSGSDSTLGAISFRNYFN